MFIAMPRADSIPAVHTLDAHSSKGANFVMFTIEFLAVARDCQSLENGQPLSPSSVRFKAVLFHLQTALQGTQHSDPAVPEWICQSVSTRLCNLYVKPI